MSSGARPQLPCPASEQDLLGLPEEGRGYELIDGELLEKEAGFRHGRAQFTMASLLAPYNRRSGGGDRPGGWWFLTEQLVEFAPGRVLRPDVAGWLRERLAEPPKHDDAIVRVRPDWVCEIISPKKPNEDLIRKRRIYHAQEVSFYWIVDPRDELLFVLQWTAKGYLEVLIAQRGERVRAEPFAAIEFPVGALFGDDDDRPDAP